MIYETLDCFAGELNEFFRAELKNTEDKVVVSAIINQDGSVAIQGENKLVLTLISLEKETIEKMPNASGTLSSGANSSPQVLSMLVLCSAYFSNNYMEGLKYLTMIIAYFQQKPVFTQSNTPALHPNIEKLEFSMESVSIDQQSNMWAMLGAKHMPSVFYKIKALVFDSTVGYKPKNLGIVEG